jgi:hypothetical protein
MNVVPCGSLLTGFAILAASVMVGRPARADGVVLPAAQARSDSATAAIIAGPEVERPPVEWTLSAAVGPVFANILSPSSGVWPLSFGLMPSMAWQVDLQRRTSADRFIAGVTVQGTFNRDGGGGGPLLLGVDAFMGASWRHRLWTLEATIGAGLGAEQVLEPNDFTNFAYHLTYQLGLDVQGTVAAAVPLSRSLEALLRLDVHLTGAHDEDWFAASMIGLRYRLP